MWADSAPDPTIGSNEMSLGAVLSHPDLEIEGDLALGLTRAEPS